MQMLYWCSYADPISSGQLGRTCAVPYLSTRANILVKDVGGSTLDGVVVCSVPVSKSLRFQHDDFPREREAIRSFDAMVAVLISHILFSLEHQDDAYHAFFCGFIYNAGNR